ncbi:NUMOD3 domain-containing DNA-binding protein [Cryobacterium soli]|uniref:NUMOD3 domain-containing DNA-binding protein n=1 Tax=Cryobacterium soli TaxID=2220095 RepID=UPI001FE61576|nr:NUMOD3 domain-containing DNA-binding protein [Cryobacterium soli]
MSLAKSPLPGSIIGVIYGVRLETSPEFRYVGLTTASIRRRMQQHRRKAEMGVRNPFYDWLRKAPTEFVYVQSLQVVTSTLEDLGKAEVLWIAKLRAQGDRLLNLSEGGLGPTGIEWSLEQREAARIRSTGRSIQPRYGVDNPMYGRSHSDEQRARWSESRKGTHTGADNPNFGKFGSDHPGFGHTMSDEAKLILAAKRRGPLNPNFGKTTSAETIAKLSAATKGIPQPKSKRSAHTRYHTNKGVLKPECKYCVEDSAQISTSSINDVSPRGKKHD